MALKQEDIPSALLINHKDGDGENNYPDNLELATHSENTKHAIHVLGKMQHLQSSNPGSKLSPEQVLEIRSLCDRKAMAQTEIAKRYGISSRSVQQIAHRMTWRHLPDSTG